MVCFGGFIFNKNGRSKGSYVGVGLMALAPRNVGSCFPAPEIQSPEDPWLPSHLDLPPPGVITQVQRNVFRIHDVMTSPIHLIKSPGPAGLHSFPRTQFTQFVSAGLEKGCIGGLQSTSSPFFLGYESYNLKNSL